MGHEFKTQYSITPTLQHSILQPPRLAHFILCSASLLVKETASS
jgi:hypothetical protein